MIIVSGDKKQAGVEATQRFWDNMIDREPISTQAFWRMTVFTQIVGLLVDALLGYITENCTLDQ